MIIGLLALASILGLLISFLFWSWSARRLGKTYGAPGYGHLGYWGAGIMAITVVASYLVLGVLGNTAEGLIAMAACALSGLRCWSAESCTPGRLAVRGNADGNPYGAERCSLVAGGDPVSPMSATPTADDWNASVWDPAVQQEIERRRDRP